MLNATEAYQYFVVEEDLRSIYDYSIAFMLNIIKFYQFFVVEEKCKHSPPILFHANFLSLFFLLKVRTQTMVITSVLLI